MTEWKNVQDCLPADTDYVWVLNKQTVPYWKHDSLATRYEYHIYDAFFDRFRGWVFLNTTPEHMYISHWAYRELPEEIEND